MRFDTFQRIKDIFWGVIGNNDNADKRVIIICHFNKLIESGAIKDYDDNSTEESFDIDVFYQRGILNNLIDDNILDKLKLSTTITENLTCWLPTGKLRKFNSATEIIDYFIDWRLEKYTERIVKLIEIVNVDILNNNEKIRFINFYLEHVNEFKNASKMELITLLDENDFDDKMLDMKIWNLTGERIKALELETKKLISNKKQLEKTNNKKLYSKELEEIWAILNILFLQEWICIKLLVWFHGMIY